MVGQDSQPYASHEFVLAEPRCGYETGRILPSLKDHDEQRYIIRSILVAETTIQQVLACMSFESNMPKKNSLW